eukprot:15469128-Alexandrium_andersonii.AAC.1
MARRESRSNGRPVQNAEEHYPDHWRGNHVAHQLLGMRMELRGQSQLAFEPHETEHAAWAQDGTLEP